MGVELSGRGAVAGGSISAFAGAGGSIGSVAGAGASSGAKAGPGGGVCALLYRCVLDRGVATVKGKVKVRVQMQLNE